MSIEGIPKRESGVEIKESLEHRIQRVKYEVQSSVILHDHDMDDHEGIQKWVDDYASSFAIVFSEVLSRDPDFLDKWDNNTNSEKARSIDFFMDELRKLDGSELERAA